MLYLLPSSLSAILFKVDWADKSIDGYKSFPPLSPPFRGSHDLP